MGEADIVVEHLCAFRSRGRAGGGGLGTGAGASSGASTRVDDCDDTARSQRATRQLAAPGRCLLSVAMRRRDTDTCAWKTDGYARRRWRRWRLM